jgi:hypothetical protein
MRLPTGRVRLHRHRREAAVVTKPVGRAGDPTLRRSTRSRVRGQHRIRKLDDAVIEHVR